MNINAIMSGGGNGNLIEKGRVYWDTIRHAALWIMWLERVSGILKKIGDTWRLVYDIKELAWRWGLVHEQTRLVSIESIMFSIKG